MADTPIKDENLRLVLSKGHEDYLLLRIKERNFLNGVLVGLWSAIPVLLMLLSSLPEWLGFLVIIILMSTPFALLVIAGNLWIVQKHWKYYRDHNKFLNKYNRSTTPSLSTATVVRNRSMMGGAIAAIAIIAGAAISMPLISTLNEDSHLAEPGDEDCIVYASEYSDPEEELAIRVAKHPKCSNIEIRAER